MGYSNTNWVIQLNIKANCFQDICNICKILAKYVIKMINNLSLLGEEYCCETLNSIELTERQLYIGLWRWSFTAYIWQTLLACFMMNGKIVISRNLFRPPPQTTPNLAVVIQWQPLSVSYVFAGLFSVLISRTFLLWYDCIFICLTLCVH